MIIRPYAGMPRMYAPDIGEIIEARRTPADRFTKAVVLNAYRNRAANLRLRIQWLEDDPRAGSGDPRFNNPIRAGSHGWIIVVQDDGAPSLVRQVSKGAPPR